MLRGVRLLAVCGVVFGVELVLTAFFAIVWGGSLSGAGSEGPPEAFFATAAVVFVGPALVAFLMAAALWMGASWGWTLSVVVSAFWLVVGVGGLFSGAPLYSFSSPLDTTPSGETTSWKGSLGGWGPLPIPFAVGSLWYLTQADVQRWFGRSVRWASPRIPGRKVAVPSSDPEGGARMMR